MNNRIELECLPPHTTTILQPLDVVTLHKVKTAWRTLLTEHNTKTNSAPIGKAKFSSMVRLLAAKKLRSRQVQGYLTWLFFQISDLWKNYVLKGHCSGGFAKAGIYPFDPRAVSKEKLLTQHSSNNTTDLSDEATIMDDTLMPIPSSSFDQSSNTNRVLATAATQTEIDHSISFTDPTQPITMTFSSSDPDIPTAIPSITSTSSSVSLDTAPTTTGANFSSPPDNNDDSNSSNAPVYTDLTNQRIISPDNSLSTQRSPLNVLTNVINQFMTTSTPVTSQTQRRQQVDRHRGESLTSVEVLARLEEKEKTKKRKTCAASKSNSTNGIPKKR